MFVRQVLGMCNANWELSVYYSLGAIRSVGDELEQPIVLGQYKCQL
jgi:hypothetical protein